MTRMGKIVDSFSRSNRQNEIDKIGIEIGSTGLGIDHSGGVHSAAFKQSSALNASENDEAHANTKRFNGRKDASRVVPNR